MLWKVRFEAGVGVESKVEGVVVWMEGVASGRRESICVWCEVVGG